MSMRTLKEMIKELPLKRQKEIAARVKELIAEEMAQQEKRKTGSRGARISHSSQKAR
jgi:hypothetical protein